MTFTRRLVLAAFGATALSGLSFAATAQELPGNLRMVVGSKSTGGDTYQASSIIADALGKQLNINVKADPVGATEGFKALDRDDTGATIMMFHDQAYLGYLYGQKGYDDLFANYKVGPTVATNPGNAYLAKKGSKFNSMAKIFEAAKNGEKVRVAIQPGGVSEIGFSAIRNAAKVQNPGSEANIVRVNTGDQASKNQAMWDNLADVINGSIQSNEQFTQLPADDQKSMEFVWITASPDTLAQAPEAGMGKLTRDDMLKYAAPKVNVPLEGGKDFTFDKEFFIVYNKNMDDALIKKIDDALAAVYKDGKVQETLKASFFTPDFRPSAQAQKALKQKADTYDQVLKNIGATRN